MVKKRRDGISTYFLLSDILEVLKFIYKINQFIEIEPIESQHFEIDLRYNKPT